MGIMEGIGKVFNKGTYRTHVMYDFSLVTKAKFYKYALNSSGSWEFTGDVLPVQINPNVTSYGKEANIDPLEGLDASNDDPLKGINEITGSEYKVNGAKGSDFNVKLTFDVFDEYMARTANDTLPLDTISILDEGVTICHTLHALTGRSDIAVKYVWGNQIEVFGQLKSVNVDISAFSRWGTPLKGEADVTIEVIGNPDISNSEATSALLEAQQNLETAQLTSQVAALVASEALR